RGRPALFIMHRKRQSSGSRSRPGHEAELAPFDMPSETPAERLAHRRRVTDWHIFAEILMN
ncbi:MAG: hypothetical protein LWW75_08830, partial [Chlorobiales bacterium]|nr:hypothetical protein [Chlorobiales bacterium]